jgi:HD-GYP domain-containing protein (c-di-GMP phosphodiesterase class II)
VRARISAVADRVDVMLNDRPYGPAVRLGEAAAELPSCNGPQFDPRIVDTFFDVPVEQRNRIRSYHRGQGISVTGTLDTSAPRTASW